jgi:hypothetical protein
MSFIITDHFKSQMRAKGFTGEQVIACLKSPEKITDVRRYPGQKRYCGHGVAVVVAKDGITLITLYVDGIVTPIRPDQMNDSAALNSRRCGKVA